MDSSRAVISSVDERLRFLTRLTRTESSRPGLRNHGKRKNIPKNNEMILCEDQKHALAHVRHDEKNRR